MPAREIPKLDPAHVLDVTNAISTLGFCAPVLLMLGSPVSASNAAHRCPDQRTGHRVWEALGLVRD
jgi:hypothetical protein